MRRRRGSGIKRLTMKYLLIALLSGLTAVQASANGPVDGYLITSTNDTVRCKIFVSDLQLFDQVHVIDALGNDSTYHAYQQSIGGFGFIYKKNRYDYVPKVDEAGHRQFLIRIVKGERLSLYYHFDMVEMYRGGLYRDETYLLEDSAGHVLTIPGNSLANYKKKIREFLYKDNDLRLLFNKMVFTISDIPKFVRAAKKQG
jgi:hypothetical protein